MNALSRWWSGLGQASRSPRIVLGATVAAVAVALYLLASALTSPEHELRVSAGDEEGRRQDIAEVLAELCEEHGVRLVIEPTSGSADALDRIAHRRLDLALVQGGLPAARNVREVAPLHVEPLHLLVRDPGVRSLEDLRHRTIDLGPEGSGTRELALDLLRLVRMRPGRDFEDAPLSYDELQSKPVDQLPDAFFHVSTMPSPVAEFLLHRRGYRLLPLPYAEAMHLRDIGIRSGTIPAFTYGVSPAHPGEDVETVATRMLIVAHDGVPNEVVRSILEVVDSGRFEREADVSPRLHESMAEPELTLHDGALEWMHRNDPVVTPELIDNVESLRSFLVSLVVALFFGWRWFRARQQSGFEAYLHRVTKLEREVLKLELDADLDLPRLLTIQRKLGQLKNEALEGYGAGKIRSADLLNSFIAHVTDVRTNLNALILHERERLEKIARRSEDEQSVRRELWRGAIAKYDDEDET